MKLAIRQLALFILVLFIVTSIIIYNTGFTEQRNYEHLKLEKSIETIDDYDAACSGYSYGHIIREQKRVLSSLRQELENYQKKVEESRSVHEELQKLITHKQLELSTLESEIDAAQRQLQEIRENRNVRVFLPYAPIKGERHYVSAPAKISSFYDIIDFSRCSITSFMPLYIDVLDKSDHLLNEWFDAFNGVIQNRVNSEDEACFTILLVNNVSSVNYITNRNTLIFNTGEVKEPQNEKVMYAQAFTYRKFDIPVNHLVPTSNLQNIRKNISTILPYSRNIFIAFIHYHNINNITINQLRESSTKSGDNITIIDCSNSCKNRVDVYKSSMFCILPTSKNFIFDFYYALQSGCIPVVFTDAVLPFESLIDWRLASFRIPEARLPEIHFICRSISMPDVLELRRKGRFFYENYLATKNELAKTLISSIRFLLQMPTMDKTSVAAKPLFNNSFTSPKGVQPNSVPNMDDDIIGPIEYRIASTSFLHNFTQFQLYAYDTWNKAFDPHETKEFFVWDHEPPAETEFQPDTQIGFRPIEPGSGVEFSRALGGNREREQFTAVMLTYERDAVLKSALERLNQIPYLNKIIVIWNNVDREPPDTWPNLHVPVEFVKVEKNSLNNRFIPWDRIETEAVFSLDDDIDLMQQEIVLAFRIWRENRDRIVGFPARYHARYGDSIFYNSNHTCQLSIILTGAAFIHKSFFGIYTHHMPSEIREHVDDVTNCEDIAMNFLVSHLTRKPPIKTTSRWTIKCAGCKENLSQSETHFDKRHECIRKFTAIYGYNPLRFSQFRADSVLFKTRVPQNHQKCFKFV